MEIICPRCGSRYHIDPPSTKRRSAKSLKLRCTSCSHSFSVDPALAPASPLPASSPSASGRPPPRALEPAPQEADHLPLLPAGEAIRLIQQAGQIYEVPDMGTLLRWIVEHRVQRTDQFSVFGHRWNPLGDRQDLERFFAAAASLRERRPAPATPEPQFDGMDVVPMEEGEPSRRPAPHMPVGGLPGNDLLTGAAATAAALAAQLPIGDDVLEMEMESASGQGVEQPDQDEGMLGLELTGGQRAARRAEDPSGRREFLPDASLSDAGQAADEESTMMMQQDEPAVASIRIPAPIPAEPPASPMLNPVAVAAQNGADAAEDAEAGVLVDRTEPEGLPPMGSAEPTMEAPLPAAERADATPGQGAIAQDAPPAPVDPAEESTEIPAEDTVESSFLPATGSLPPLEAMDIPRHKPPIIEKRPSRKRPAQEEDDFWEPEPPRTLAGAPTPVSNPRMSSGWTPPAPPPEEPEESGGTPGWVWAVAAVALLLMIGVGAWGWNQVQPAPVTTVQEVKITPGPAITPSPASTVAGGSTASPAVTPAAPTATAVPSPATPSPKPTPSATATPKPTPSATATPKPTPSATATPKPTPSATATPAATPATRATAKQGWAALDAGDTQKAYDIFDRVVQAQPSNADALYGRAYTSARLGNSAGALTDYCAALRYAKSADMIAEINAGLRKINGTCQ